MYSDKFFTDREQLTRTSAEKIVGLLCQMYLPNHIIDFGCANGVWLKAFKDRGVKNVMGIDGPWVKSSLLRIPESSFFVHNLSDRLPEGKIGKVDMAVSLEVAEHLPEDRAPSFIEELTNAADVVLFSAGIVKQGGTGHLNEQPQSYWCKLFAEHGFVCLDIIRPEVWYDHDVNVVYRQNCFIYTRQGRESLFAASPYSSPTIMDIVHPSLFERRLSQKSKKRGINSRIKKTINAFIKRS